MFEVCTNQHDEDTKICRRDARWNGEFVVRSPPAARARRRVASFSLHPGGKPPNLSLRRRQTRARLKPRLSGDLPQPGELARCSSSRRRRGCSRSRLARARSTRFRVLGLGIPVESQCLGNSRTSHRASSPPLDTAGSGQGVRSRPVARTSPCSSARCRVIATPGSHSIVAVLDLHRVAPRVRGLGRRRARALARRCVAPCPSTLGSHCFNTPLRSHVMQFVPALNRTSQAFE